MKSPTRSRWKAVKNQNIGMNDIFFENVEMFNTFIRELHQHIKTIIILKL